MSNKTTLNVSTSIRKKRGGAVEEVKMVCRSDGGILSFKFGPDHVRVYASGFEVSPGQWQQLLTAAAEAAEAVTMTPQTRYSDLRAAVGRAALAFAPFALPDWAGYIVYLLEALEGEAAGRAGDFDAVLESVETAITIRRAGGRW